MKKCYETIFHASCGSVPPMLPRRRFDSVTEETAHYNSRDASTLIHHLQYFELYQNQTL